MSAGKERISVPVLELDLLTGESRLVRRRKFKKRQEPISPHERSVISNTWFSQMGLDAFVLAFETWRIKKGAQLSENAHQNIEFYSAQLSGKDGEIALREAIGQTRFKAITCETIAREIKNATSLIKQQSVYSQHVINKFLEWAIDIVAEEKGLKNPEKIASLKAFVIQPRLPFAIK